MQANSALEEALALVLKLAPKERLQLVERVVASVERDIAPHSEDETDSTEHWGQNLLRLVQASDLDNWTDIHIEDPVEWVKHVRQLQAQQRNLNWGEEE